MELHSGSSGSPEETHNWGDNWHADLTGLPEPPLGSVPYAKDVPPYESEHPLVRTHPVTVRKSLFIARKKMRQICGMTPGESAPMLGFLCDHTGNPDFACRFRWRKGSVAFWDNRCTQHRVSADYFYALRDIEPRRRHMHRVTIKGDRPR